MPCGEGYVHIWLGKELKEEMKKFSEDAGITLGQLLRDGAKVKMQAHRLSEKIWNEADRLMDSDDELENEMGLQLTIVAQVLDEISGRFDWGILEALKDV